MKKPPAETELCKGLFCSGDARISFVRITKAWILDIFPLILVLLVSGVSRVVSAFVAVGESGGDLYNYLLMGQSFSGGETIFLEKRLPVYALLLIPGDLIGHPLGWARFLGIVFSLLALYFLYRLLLDLRLPKAVALTSLILLSFQSTFFLFSIRPLSHTLFNFELILCLYLFYRLTRGFTAVSNFSKLSLRQIVVFGLVLGITAMTRHEGFLVAGVLTVCLLVYMLWKFGRAWIPAGAGLMGLGVAFLIVVAPWFASNYQRFGSPFYTEYQTDAGLNVAYTSEKLLGNFLQMRDIFLGMWGNLGFVSMKEPWSIVTRVESVGEIITVLTVILMFIGLWVFIRHLKWAAVPILIIFITQMVFLTVVQPWPRHSQHLFFVPAVFLALGLYSALGFLVSRWRGNDKSKRMVGVLATIILMPVWVYLIQGDQTALEGYWRGSQKTLPLTTAAATLQQRLPEGRVLVSEKFKTEWSDEYSLIKYYLGDRITYNLEDNPKYILDYNGSIVTR